MNPKIKIAVDAKNKAIAAFEGMATVGAKIDVEITGLPSGIEDWGAGDDFVGKSVRFRIVDELGKDLVRFPIVKKTTATDGDQWQVVPATSTTPETYKTYNGTTYAQVDFDTDKLRKAFCGVAFNDKLEFGVIIDSYVDKAEFAIGKVKIQQWAAASTEDPTVLPDWRETLAKLKTDLEAVEASKTAAETAASNAATSAQSAGGSATTAGGWATSASISANSASVSANSAGNSATAAGNAQTAAETAQDAAEEAQEAAEAAASKYPYVDENGHWKVWENGAWVDKGSAKGDKGDTGTAATVSVGTTTTGAAGTDADVTNVGTTSAAVFNFVIPRGPKGDDGEDGSIVSVSSTGTATDEVRYITIDGVEKKLAGGGSGTGNYEDLTNKPQIGSVTLSGNKTLGDLGAVAKSSSIPTLGDDPTEDEVIASVKYMRSMLATSGT